MNKTIIKKDIEEFKELIFNNDRYYLDSVYHIEKESNEDFKLVETKTSKVIISSDTLELYLQEKMISVFNIYNQRLDNENIIIIDNFINEKFYINRLNKMQEMAKEYAKTKALLGKYFTKVEIEAIKDYANRHLDDYQLIK